MTKNKGQSEMPADSSAAHDTRDFGILPRQLA